MSAVLDDPKAAAKQAHEINKLSKRLHRQVGQAIGDFNMIEAGDKVMVCLSGGKDSYALLDILIELRRRAPVRFDLVAVNLDQKQPGFPEHVLPEYLKSRDIPFHIEGQDTYSIVKRLVPEGQTMCSLCSRLRRGILYRVAGELGATKIALGHHRDDMLQTLFMNMFFGSRLKGMPPKLVSDDGKNIVIRPLAYVAETDLERWAAHRQFPGRLDNIFTAMGNIVPSHMMDRKLYPFTTLKTTGVVNPEGDRAFDEDEDCAPPEAQPIRIQRDD